MNTSKKQRRQPLPYDVIVQASEGNNEALDTVLKHFDGYINTLATKRLYDEHGNTYLYVDQYRRQRLINKLISKILGYNAA